jgi:hypothetical protein
MTQILKSLNRTFLLIRDEVGEAVPDTRLKASLTGVKVALVVDGANIASHSAQTAFVTAALLMARSAHQVWLVAPNVTMQGAQPPLAAGRLIDQLVALGQDLLPGVSFKTGAPPADLDLAVGLGDTPLQMSAGRRVWINAEPWAGLLSTHEGPRPWIASLWPMGALAAAGLAAGEAFKVAMLRLAPLAFSPANTAARFAFSDSVRFELAPDGTPFCRDLGELDVISGGAIAHAALYCVARIPAVSARGRIVEPEAADLSNLNRYMLLRRSALGPKAADLASLLRGVGLRFQAVPERYDAQSAAMLAPLAPTVLVGVDHIPTRWLVQQAWPDFLVVGATTHWSAMASFHAAGVGCAQCLHNEDDPGDGLIPTQACVSFWAGLLSACYLARHAAGALAPGHAQQVFLTPFRPETPFWAPVPLRARCPTCGGVFTSSRMA